MKRKENIMSRKPHAFPGGKFKVDYADYLSQYAVVCERPVERGCDALLVGGGDLVGVAWNPGDCFKIVINKSDILTQVPSEANFWGDEDDTNIPIHAGVLSINGGVGLFSEPDKFRFEQSVFDGIIGLKTRKGTDEIEIQSWVAFRENILVLKVKPGKQTTSAFRLELARMLNPHYGKELVLGNDSAWGWIHYRGEKGASYALMLHSDRGELECVDNRIGLVIPKEGATFMLTVVTHNQAANVLEAARGKIMEFKRKGLNARLAEHRKRWLDFWKRSFIHTSQAYLNNLWYLNLYYMAISSRGLYPVKFNGALFNWREDDYRKWGGGFWSLNQTRSYEGLFHSDHMELMDNMYGMLRDYLPEARAMTKYHFDIDGIWFPEILKPWQGSQSPSVRMDGEKIKAMRYPRIKSINAWIRTSAAHYGMLFWRRYQLTGDLEFLKEYAYPLLKGTADFYAGYVVKKRDGKYHIPISTASETPPAGQDAISDLACIQWLFPAVIASAKALKIRFPEKPQYLDILKNLAPYPQWNGVYTHIRYKGKPVPWRNTVIDWTEKKQTVRRYFLWHAPQNYPVFPWGVIGKDSKNYETARRTYWLERYNMDWLCGDHAMPAVRLGLKEETYRQLHRMICCYQNLKQGLFMEHHDVQLRTQARKDLWMQAYLSASGPFLEMVNESLLQGHRGFIDVFPAFPDEWEGCFSLLCEGGFMVSGEASEGGHIRYVALHSRLGNQCRFLNPWSIKPHVFELASGRTLKYTCGKNQNMLSFPTGKGMTYIIEPAKGSYAGLKTKVFRAELEPCAKMLGHAVLGQGEHYSHKQTWSVW